MDEAETLWGCGHHNSELRSKVMQVLLLGRSDSEGGPQRHNSQPSQPASHPPPYLSPRAMCQGCMCGWVDGEGRGGEREAEKWGESKGGRSWQLGSMWES